LQKVSAPNVNFLSKTVYYELGRLFAYLLGQSVV